MPMFKPRYEASAVQLTHGGLEAFYADLVLQGDRQAVQGTNDFPGLLQVFVQLPRTLQCTFDEDLGEAVDLYMAISPHPVPFQQWEPVPTYKLVCDDRSLVESSGYLD